MIHGNVSFKAISIISNTPFRGEELSGPLIVKYKVSHCLKLVNTACKVSPELKSGLVATLGLLRVVQPLHVEMSPTQRKKEGDYM